MFHDVPSVSATTFRISQFDFVEKIDAVDINSARNNRQFFFVVSDFAADADFQFGRDQIRFEKIKRTRFRVSVLLKPLVKIHRQNLAHQLGFFLVAFEFGKSLVSDAQPKLVGFRVDEQNLSQLFGKTFEKIPVRQFVATNQGGMRIVFPQIELCARISLGNVVDNVRTFFLRRLINFAFNRRLQLTRQRQHPHEQNFAFGSLVKFAKADLSAKNYVRFVIGVDFALDGHFRFVPVPNCRGVEIRGQSERQIANAVIVKCLGNRYVRQRIGRQTFNRQIVKRHWNLIVPPIVHVKKLSFVNAGAPPTK